MTSIYKLKNPIQEYPWGSTRLIPELLGESNPKNRTFAEMWMGVHSRGPSIVRTGEGERSLSEFIAANPVLSLGEEAAGRFQGDLPFLFKLLAAGQPLSIQAHPNRVQAEEGYDREEREGIPIDAFHRNYRDRNHKPELICALTPFTAMCGFREPEAIFRLFSGVDAELVRSELLPILSDKEREEEKRLETFFHRLMSMTDAETEDLVRALVDWAMGAGNPEALLVRRFHELHGVDRGLAAPLFLNVLELERGEALYQPAGVLHAYVEGMGVELMANSDNVLRGGLTKKHVDPDELRRLLSFSPRRPDILAPRELKPGLEEYPVPIDEFLLRRARPSLSAENVLEVEGRSSIEIALCVEGSLELEAHSSGADGFAGADPGRGGESRLRISKGESLLVPHGAGSYRLQGDGELFIATIPAKLDGGEERTTRGEAS